MTDDGTPGVGGRLWAAIRKAPERAAGAESMVRDLFGSTPRGTPDTRAAADQLGVSQRTVQRWIKDGVPRRSEGAERLQQGHQGWKGSPAGRRSALSPRREARLRNKGTSLVFFGTIAISGDRRKRSTTVPVTGAQMAAILDAGLAGDDAAAHAALEEAFGSAFGGSVSLDIDRLDTFR